MAGVRRWLIWQRNHRKDLELSLTISLSAGAIGKSFSYLILFVSYRSGFVLFYLHSLHLQNSI